METYQEVSEKQRRRLIVGGVDDDGDADGGGAMKPITHTDGQLVRCWLRPFRLGLDVVD